MFLLLTPGDVEQQVLHAGLVQHPEDLIVDGGVVFRPALPPHVGRHLQDVPDEDQHPLDDQLVVLQPLVPVLLEESREGVGQDSPQLLVNKGLFIALSVGLNLKVVISSFLVLGFKT